LLTHLKNKQKISKIIDIMKKVIYSLMIVGVLIFTGCKSEKKETIGIEKKETNVVLASANFGVRGNCGMCKATIEKAANSIEGVASAIWDKAKKKMEVSFDASKTNALAVETAIANSGYDTENVMGNLESYKGLPGCCKYDHSMDMNQTGENKSNETH
jgi:copper chaperone CopZ